MAALLVAAAVLRPVAARAAELEFATLAPKGSSWAKSMDRAAREIGRLTDRRVVVKFHYGGQAGDERDVVRKLRDRTLAGAAFTGVGLSLIREDVKVIELPFLYRSEAEVDFVRGRMFPELERRFEDRGFVVLAWSETGWVHIFTSQPLASRADLASLKMWAWTDDVSVRELFKRVRVDGIPLGPRDVLAALEQGLVNGCYGSPQVALAMQWHSRIRYATAGGVGFSTAALVIRKDVLDALAPEDRQTVRAVAGRLGAELTRTNRRDNARARRAMERAGVKFVPFPPVLLAEFERESRAVWEALVGKAYSRELLDRVKALVAEARR